MKVNIFLPWPAFNPGGGPKIMYEYANMFCKMGHDVMVYSISTTDYDTFYKYPHWLRAIKNRIRFHHFRPSWYNLDERVKCTTIPRMKDKYVRDADVCMSTCWTIAYALHDLSPEKGKKVNLIQDYERWIGNNIEKLHESYKLPIKHVVIADYLADIVEQHSGVRPPIVYNGIDTNRFFLKENIKDRNNHTISMLYSEEERKGTQYGLEAFRIVKKKIPNLKVRLFGVFPEPDNLENWIEYNQKPDDLCSLYNSTAIYFTPSNGEGWALPPAESMFCGCALVCTNIGGHQAYAKNGITALTVEPRTPQDMAEKLLMLLENPEYRVEMATRGNEFIQQFTWKAASEKMLRIFNEKL